MTSLLADARELKGSIATFTISYSFENSFAHRTSSRSTGDVDRIDLLLNCYYVQSHLKLSANIKGLI